MKSIYFEVLSKLNKKIRITKSYWNLIVSIKHPIMKHKEKLVKDTLKNPDEIRQSKRDVSVFLYYKSWNNYFIVVVCKHLNKEGYIITTYITDKIKEGVTIWKK